MTLLFICSLTARIVPGSRLDSVRRDGLSLGVQGCGERCRPWPRGAYSSVWEADVNK